MRFFRGKIMIGKTEWGWVVLDWSTNPLSNLGLYPDIPMAVRGARERVTSAEGSRDLLELLQLGETNGWRIEAMVRELDVVHPRVSASPSTTNET